MTNSSAIWPTFYIVGAMKAGTTTLYQRLKSHPQVFFPWIKEPNYFCTLAPPIEELEKRCTGNTEKYLDLYREAGSYRARGDASISYLWDHDAHWRIRQATPDARIIIILRDPITRAYSQYLMYRKYGFESAPTFYQALQRTSQETNLGVREGNLYIEFGMYCDQVRRYLDTFGPEQVQIILTEDLNNSPAETLAAVTRHLGIDPMPLEEARENEVHNAFSMPRYSGLYHFLRTKAFPNEFRRKYFPLAFRKWLQRSPLLYDLKRPPIDDQSRLFLQDIFEPDVARLEELLSRKLPQLRKSWITAPVPARVQGEMRRRVGGTA